MIKINPHGKRLAWYTINVNVDGKPEPVKIQYDILNDQGAAEMLDESFAIAEAAGTDKAAALGVLRGQLTPEARAQMRARVRERIADWDLADEEGKKLEPTIENIDAVLNWADFLKTIYDGLLAASTGAGAKN